MYSIQFWLRLPEGKTSWTRDRTEFSPSLKHGNSSSRDCFGPKRALPRACRAAVLICVVLTSAVGTAQAIVSNPTSLQTITQPVGTSFNVNTISQTVFADQWCLYPGILDETCLQRAIDVGLPSNGGTVAVPAGTYNIAHTVVVDKDNITLAGSGDSTILNIAIGVTAISVGIPANSPPTSARNFTTIQRMHFQGAGAGETAIWLQRAHQTLIERVSSWNVGTGVKVSDASFNNYISNFYLGECANCVFISNANSTNSGFGATDFFISNGALAPADGGYGLYWENGDGLYVSQVTILHGVKGIALVPNLNQQTSSGFFTEVVSDTTDQQTWILYPQGGKVKRIVATNCWASSSKTAEGVLISGTSGVVDGFHWIGGQVLNNAHAGIFVSKGNGVVVKNIDIQDSHIYSNSTAVPAVFDGIVIDTNVSRVHITNNTIGNGPGVIKNQQRYGIKLSGTVLANSVVMGNDTSCNVTGGIAPGFSQLNTILSYNLSAPLADDPTCSLEGGN
jgi:hypothetical protein